MSTSLCVCEPPRPQLVEGIRSCTECGRQIPDPRDKLLILIARQQAAILDRLNRLDGGSSENPPSPLLSPTELARDLGKSAGWVRDHWRELGGNRIGDGPKPRYWFDAELARERLRAIGNGNGSKPEPAPKPRRRRRRKSGDVELLPVRGSK